MGLFLFAALLGAGVSVRPASASQPAIDPGIAAAVDREMDAFDAGNLPAFLDDFTDDAVIIDDAEPLFMAGKPAIREWFIDNRRGAGRVELSHLAATDYTLLGRSAFVAFPFKIAIGSPPNQFVAHGTYTATFRREADRWRIRSLTIAILTTGA
ncbi:MAG: nuclear transport factor 2 family protein [Candidatus Eremiobacteraeota bacterium]|nr:nuclear transport factor 2 family protein [Candidatus Eremiobacteraeota bacterium]